VGLAGAGRAEEHDVALLGDEVQGAEVGDQVPFDAVPTLGKVRAHLRESGIRYEYVLQGKDHAGSTAGVVAMLADLWEGHSDRHGGGPECVPVSQQAAEVAFTLAVSLVAIFATGAVRVR
jgi:hypothetical protein